MAERKNRVIFSGLKTNGTTRHSLYICRSFTEGAGATPYGNPALPFVATTNEWYLLNESVITTNSYFYADIPRGWYQYQVYDSTTTTYSVITPFDVLWHGSFDMDNHITNQDPAMGHDHEAIKIRALDTARLGNNLQLAVDNFIGAAWTDGVDDSLKTHLDDTVSAHPASAISCTVGTETDVEGALDDHETRIVALETGTASTPSGIHDFLGDLGVDVIWTAQDIAGIEYKTRHLWKHVAESVPTTYTDLSHEGRQLTPLAELPYYTRRFDLTSSPDTNLVLYYAIGAKGRADGAFTWSAVQSILVELPSFTQVFSGVLSGMSACCSSGGSTVYALDSIDIGSDENFPTATESGGSPLTEYIRQIFQNHNVTITGIEFFSQSDISDDVTMNYRSSTSGTSGTFTISSTTMIGNVTSISLPISAGDELQLWTLKPYGISHWRVKIWFTRR